MAEMDKSTMVLEDENKDLDELNNKVKCFISKLTPPQLQQSLRKIQEAPSIQSFHNIGIMVASFPHLGANLLNINNSEIVQHLNDIILRFDQLLTDHTFGDLCKVVSGQMEYTVLSGLKDPINTEVNIDAVETLLRFAIDIKDTSFEMSSGDKCPLNVSIGINCGSATIELVGSNKWHLIRGAAYLFSKDIGNASKDHEIGVSEQCKNVLIQKGYKFCRSGRGLQIDGEIVTFHLLKKRQE